MNIMQYKDCEENIDILENGTMYFYKEIMSNIDIHQLNQIPIS